VALPESACWHTKTRGVADAGSSPVNGFGMGRLRRAQVARGQLAALGHDVVANLPAFHERALACWSSTKNSKALGLEVPPTLLARADEVIE
jgi:hypothetical protein